jgi:hypothetical protein
MEEMFNTYQQEYIGYLATLTAESKCWCGWYRLGECPHCPFGKTAADKIAMWCSECHNAPSPDGEQPIIHNVTCSNRNE